METRRARGEELTELDEEYYLSLRLDEGHLFTLQLIDYIIAAVATSPLEGVRSSLCCCRSPFAILTYDTARTRTHNTTAHARTIAHTCRPMRTSSSC
jgi:hypothetical protein